jgi:hypothetical protein
MRASIAVALLAVASTRVATAQPSGQLPPVDPDPFGMDPVRSIGEPEYDCSDVTDFACAFATNPFVARHAPFALVTSLTRLRWRDLAVRDGDADDVVGLAQGGVGDDYGVAFGGGASVENRWFVDGAPVESVGYGLLDQTIPLAFVERIDVTAGGFDASDRAARGGIVDIELAHGDEHHHEVRAEAWGTAQLRADRVPIPFYNVYRTAPAPHREASVAVVMTGPIPTARGPIPTWYAAGVQASLRRDDLEQDAVRRVDADTNGVPDAGAYGEPVVETLAHRTFGELAYEVPMMLRAGVRPWAHDLSFTALATAFRDTRYLGNATQSASGVHTKGYTFDGILTWKGRWNDTRARITASWHRRKQDESPRTGDANARQVQLGGVGPDFPDPALATGCDDTAGTDPYPLIANCPVGTLVATGGAGALFGETSDRPALSAEVLHRRGNHTLSAGLVAEDARRVLRQRYTGGARELEFGGLVRTEELVEITDDTAAPLCTTDDGETRHCRVVEEASVRHRTRHLALYANDEWRPRADWSFTGGLRWESMEVGDAFTFRDQLAPRVGLAWDPLGKSRSRVFAGFSRAYAMMRPGMLGNVLSAPSVRASDVFGGLETVSYGSGGYIPVADDLAPAFTEELVAGVVLVPRRAVRLTAWSQTVWERRGIEDVDILDPVLANPTGPKAERRAQLFALELATDPGARFGLRIQYQHVRSHGTHNLIDADQGPTYTSETFDVAGHADAANLSGPLANDLPHRAVVEAIARPKVGPVALSVSLRAVVTSGRAVDVEGLGELGERILLLPRGAGGRLATTTSTGLHLAADLGHGIEVVADVTNLFDRATVTRVRQNYTSEQVLPISGGTQADLVFLTVETEDGARPARRDPSFAAPTTRQAPLAASIGVRASF